MASDERVDEFYDQIAREVPLRVESEPDQALDHFLVIREAERITICRMKDDTEGTGVDSILAFHIEGGADAAAFVTRRQDQVVGQILLGKPSDSDIRRALLTKANGRLSLGSWESLF
jgi:hypothetical protein